MKFEPKDEQELIKEGYELYKTKGADTLIDEYSGYLDTLWEWVDIDSIDPDEGNCYSLENYLNKIMGVPMDAIEEVISLIDDENQEQADYIAKYVEISNGEYDHLGYAADSVFERD